MVPTSAWIIAIGGVLIMGIFLITDGAYFMGAVDIVTGIIVAGIVIAIRRVEQRTPSESKTDPTHGDLGNPEQRDREE